MDERIQSCSPLDLGVDGDEAKYFSSLSTILVATIQEAKDRIAQIEYIFCRQIYPDFLQKHKILQKVYSDARKTAEEAWNEKEKDFLNQIERLQQEKQRAQAENESLEFDKEKHLLKLETKIVEAFDKDEKLKEYEGKTNMLLAEAKGLGKTIDNLQEELKKNTEHLTKEKLVTANLLRKVESLSSEIADKERMVDDIKDRDVVQARKLETLEASVGRLESMLKEKTNEVDNGKEFQEQLRCSLEKSEAVALESKQRLIKQEKENKVLVGKIKNLEEENADLLGKIKDQNHKAGNESDSFRDICQENELISKELSQEKRKVRDLTYSYKHLKSQYCFLLSKNNLTTERKVFRNDNEKSGSLYHHRSPSASPVIGNKRLSPECNRDAEGVNSISNVKTNLGEDKGKKKIQASGSHVPFLPMKCRRVSGTKRPVSSWRETRARQEENALDPHDDFLDTPLENFKKDLNRTMNKDYQNRTSPGPKDHKRDDMEDETQDVGLDTSPPKQQIPGVAASKRPFKYIEPVKKKSEREKLKGVECKQCKKFFDAVLPVDGSKEEGGSKKRFRCEHHEGISRHRYRYAPPLTPEGFWNIGFESEM